MSIFRVTTAAAMLLAIAACSQAGDVLKPVPTAAMPGTAEVADGVGVTPKTAGGMQVYRGPKGQVVLNGMGDGKYMTGISVTGTPAADFHGVAVRRNGLYVATDKPRAASACSVILAPVDGGSAVQVTENFCAQRHGPGVTYAGYYTLAD